MANTIPIFPLLPVIGLASFSDALTTRTTTENTGLTNLVTGSAEGTRIDSIILKAAGNTVAGQVWLWLHTTGADARCFHEIAVPVVSTANITTIATWSTRIDFPSLVLTTGVSLMASTTVNQLINAIVLGGSY